MMNKTIVARVEFSIDVPSDASDEEIREMLRDFLVDQIGSIDPEIVEEMDEES